MTLYERISFLAKKQGKSLNRLAEDIGLSKNAMYQWKTSSPKVDTLEKVADYFGVSVDYLLERTDKLETDSSALTDYEESLLMMFRKGERDIPESKKDLYRKQAIDMMGFIGNTMRELDEKNKPS